jgi:hypothetical protein
MRIAMLFAALAVFCSGCKMLDSMNEVGEKREQKRAEEKKKEAEAPRSSVFYGLNDYERAYVDDYYKNLEKAKKDRKKKVFGY